MSNEYDTKQLPVKNIEATSPPDSGAPAKDRSKFQKPYVFYCIMTLSVMLFTLAFAASELFSLFFTDGDIGQVVMSKLFGSDALSGKSIQEIMLGQSFVGLSVDKSTEKDTSFSDTEKTPDDTTAPTDTSSPSTEGSINDGTEPPPSEDIYAYDPVKIPSGMSGIIPLDLGLAEYGNSYIYNQSSFTPDLSSLNDISVSTSPDGIYPEGAPLVLIVHTHGTEGYTDEGALWYDPSKEIARSSDISENVVYIGKVISDALNAAGISTLHCEVMHDADGYSGSYDRSAATIKKYLAEYPSIQYVIDVHRDAVVRSTGELVRPVIATESGSAAQIMCVVGSGGKDSEILGWEQNLALAQKLRQELNSKNEGICRPTCLRDSSYNQQYATYSLLLEMGAAGNTLREAESAAREVAKALVRVIYG